MRFSARFFHLAKPENDLFLSCKTPKRSCTAASGDGSEGYVPKAILAIRETEDRDSRDYKEKFEILISWADYRQSQSTWESPAVAISTGLETSLVR